MVNLPQYTCLCFKTHPTFTTNTFWHPNPLKIIQPPSVSIAKIPTFTILSHPYPPQPANIAQSKNVTEHHHACIFWHIFTIQHCNSSSNLLFQQTTNSQTKLYTQSPHSTMHSQHYHPMPPYQSRCDVHCLTISPTVSPFVSINCSDGIAVIAVKSTFLDMRTFHCATWTRPSKATMASSDHTPPVDHCKQSVRHECILCILCNFR